jgi:murein DD-endopeptidase MepM/ murein hydrolase activator NlpD
VKAGDRVAAGQLLGSMGLGFSFENGGHFAHLHFGVYPGPFQPRHNYGYKPASEGLSDWIDPAAFLAARNSR